ncbi:helix-turn-helix domain-containing protein [Streptomyces sp. NPDC101132]|uniref:helix-turn-helix domain-containing protein n=1 Tax=Streptomyces sp. NPDC101132 TaxID=3366110 RepID=UPI003804816F
MEQIHREPAPHEAGDAAGFVDLMRSLKDRSGYTYRQLEERAAERGDVLPRSTLASVLGGRTLPRPELLAAFVRACGDEDRMDEWVGAWAGLAGQQAVEAGSGTTAVPPAGGPVPGIPGASGASVPDAGTGGAEPASRRESTARMRAAGTAGGARRTLPWRLNWRTAAAALVTAAALTAAGMLAGQESSGGDAESGSASGAGSTADPVLPTGWVQIHPAGARSLCLTDGRVRDRRYTPLVAVQRPCASVGPQNTLLHPLGGDLYEIQWHHPDYGKGCLRALTEADGAGGTGLLEPMDDCSRGSRFHVEPSGPRGDGVYVFRVDGQGCVGIRGAGREAGTEAVMERCTGKGGQLFTIEAVS